MSGGTGDLISDAGGGAATGAAVGGPWGAAIGGGLGFLKWLLTNNANQTAMDRGYAALDKAQGAIQGYADKSVALQQPYLQNAAQDYARQRQMVQSGYYQTPYGQSFNPGQMTPTSFAFNPSQGTASFGQNLGTLNSFTPQALPPMPAFQMPQQGPAPTPGPQMGMQKPTMQVIRDLMLQTMPLNPTPGLPNQYVPQTGQNNPLQQAGFKPADPRLPSLQDLINMRTRYPFMFGSSGPLEGGMPQGGRF